MTESTPSPPITPATAPATSSLRSDVAMILRGLCMGGADIIPGVSGGTVALILGIYLRLVTAISHFDLKLLGLVRDLRFRDAARHVDLRFLVTLAMGIVGGFAIMTVLMHHLLTTASTRELTLAAFFGMILGSGILVSRLIEVKSLRQSILLLLVGLVAALFAWWLTTLPQSPQTPSLLFIFAAGCVAICAMILPGISGAMILLILGVYIHLTEIPHNLAHGEKITEGLVTILVFGSGCAISLICFSKLLRWLLVEHKSVTMSILCGFMFGALRKLWPFQQDLTPEIADFKHKNFQPIWPEQLDGHAVVVCLIAVGAMVLVLIVDHYSQRTQRASSKANTSAP